MATATLRKSKSPERQIDVHALLDFLDRQGSFSEKEYLALTDHTNRLVEFTDGFLEILPMPTDYHQVLLRFAFLAFYGYITPLGGTVHFSPLRVRIRKRKFREPDLLLLLSATDPRRQNRFWMGADLVLEVVSEDKPERDLVDKRKDYAAAKIPEYWIINPLSEQILVFGFGLTKNRYRQLGKYGQGEIARSTILPGFQLNVTEVFAAK